MSKKLISLCFVVALLGTSYGATVIGNWENWHNGWIDWGNGKLISDPCNMPSKYQYEGEVGDTLQDTSLHVIQAGWGQSLAIKLQNNGFVDEFLANDHLIFDYTVKAGTAGGWNEIYQVYVNAPTWGFTGLGTAPIFHYNFWNGSGERTTTVVLDYSAAKAAMGPTPGYVEIIFALNSGDGQNDFYFDKAMLIPEPATIALLGLGGLLLRRRKR